MTVLVCVTRTVSRVQQRTMSRVLGRGENEESRLAAPRCVGKGGRRSLFSRQCTVSPAASMSTPATPMEVDPSPVVASTSVLPAELPRASTPTRKPKAPKQQPRVETLSRTYMREGDNVLLRLPSDVIKAAVISLNGLVLSSFPRLSPFTPLSCDSSISLGKFGSFQAKLLIGRPYGDTYEIKNGQLHVLNSTLREVGEYARETWREFELMEEMVEETSATNEKIASTGAQGLSHEDIESLRNEGLSGRVRPLVVPSNVVADNGWQEIIARQIEEHAAFELKTEFSKDKYLKRKEAKYVHPSLK